MVRDLLENQRLGKLSRKTFLTVKDSDGTILFHMPFDVILNHCDFMHGVTHVPEVDRQFYSGNLKLMFSQKGVNYDT